MCYKRLIGAILLSAGLTVPPALGADISWPVNNACWYDIDGDGVMEWVSNNLMKFSSDYTTATVINTDLKDIYNWCYFNSDANVDCSGKDYKLFIGKGNYVWENFLALSSAEEKNFTLNPIDFNNDGRTELIVRNKYHSERLSAFALLTNAKGEIIKDRIEILTPEQYADSRKDLNLSIGGEGIPGWDDMFGRDPVSDPKSLGSFSALDINGDGLPDFVDYENGTYFLNTGDGRLVQSSFGANVFFRDLNGDGICDYIIYDSNSKTISAFIVNRGSAPSEIVLMKGFSFNSVLWCNDFDHDGDVDILIPFDSSGNMPGFLVMMENIGGGKFRQLEYALDSDVVFKHCADIDADGNYEILAYHKDSDSSIDIISYKVNGLSVKSEYETIASNQYSYYLYTYFPLYAIDFDGSGRTRIFTGNSPYYTTKWFEPFPDARNHAPAAPSKPELTFDEATGRLSIRWSPASDTESSSVDLTYELRIGTTETGGEIMRPHAKADGKRLNLMPGANGHSCFRVIDTKTWPAGRYYIAVQAVDPGCLGSAFSQTVVFEKRQPFASFSIINDDNFSTGDIATITLPVVPASSDELFWDWNGANVIESAADRSEYKISFPSGGDKTIKLQVKSANGVLSAPYSRTISVHPAKYKLEDSKLSPKLVIDLNCDGSHEILTNGKLYESDAEGLYNPVKKIFNTNLELLNTPQICDINLDGKPDIISYRYDKSTTRMTEARMLINSGDQNMEKSDIYSSWAPPLDHNEWVDIDNDGIYELFAYNGMMKFSDNYTKYRYTQVFGLPFDDRGYLQTSSNRFYDYDRDGLLDVIGKNNEGLFEVYRNNGDNTFTKIQTLYIGEAISPIAEDIDGDGLTDFAYCNGSYGFGVTFYKEFAYISFGIGKMMEIQCPANDPFYQIRSIFDFDNNGFKDILVECQNSVVIIYFYPDYSYHISKGDFNTSDVLPYYDATGKLRLGPNSITTNTPNTCPTVPGTPRATQNTSAVLIEWNAATDAETPQSAIRYNISIKHKGTEGTGAYFISPLNDGLNGVRPPYPARLLNSTRFTIPITSIAPGEYEVKVQAVDGVYEVSDFSQTSTFSVTEHAVLDMPLSAIVGDEVVIKFISNITDADISYGDGAEIISSDASGSTVRWTTPGVKTVCIGTAAKSTIFIHELPEGGFELPSTVLCGASVTLKCNASLQSEWDVAEGDGEFTSIETSANVKLNTDTKGSQSFTFIKAGTYTLQRTVKTDYGSAIFTASTQVSDNNAMPVIDRVDIDNTHGKYAIHWTAPQDIVSIIKTVNIYKEGNRIDQYELIGTTDVSDGMFVDSLSTPSVQSARYCINYTLDYGESQRSAAHQSMHLMLNTAPSGWNLMWSRYEGRQVTAYRILRGTAPDALLQLTEISGNMASFTDTEVPENEAFYAVEPIFEPAAARSRTAGESVQSNIVSTLQAHTGVPIESIRIVADRDSSLKAGDDDALYLRANIMPVNATFRKINWVITAGSDIASIDANGILRSISDKGGTVTVTAYATDGSGVSDKMDILMIVTPDEPDEPILDPPGTHYIYSMTAHITSSNRSECIYRQDFRVDVRIDEENNTMYFRNLIANHKTQSIEGSWVKGYIIEDGTKVFIPDGQILDYDPIRKAYMRISTSECGEYDNKYNGTLLNYNKEDGYLASTDPTQRQYIGTYRDNISIAYYKEYTYPFHLSRFEELGKERLQLPEDAVPEEYTMYYTSSKADGVQSRKVKIAIYKWRFYVQGFHDVTGDRWLPISINEKGATYQKSWDHSFYDDRKFYHIIGCSRTFTNLDYLEYSSPVNFSRNDIYTEITQEDNYFMIYTSTYDNNLECENISNVRFVKDGPTSLSPQAPDRLKLSTDNGEYITILAEQSGGRIIDNDVWVYVINDTFGNHLRAAKCGFRMYLDGELMTFTPEDYPGLSESTDILMLGKDYGIEELKQLNALGRFIKVKRPQQKLEVATAFIASSGIIESDRIELELPPLDTKYLTPKAPEELKRISTYDGDEIILDIVNPISYKTENDEKTYGIFTLNGNWILASKCGSRVYVNGELYIFTPENYPGLSESTDILMLGKDYGTTKLEVLYGVWRRIYLKKPVQKVEVSNVYISSFGEFESERTELAIEESGIGTIGDGSDDIINVEYFDVAGRKVKPSATGCYIRRITFKDGHTVNEKVGLRP